MGRSSSYTAYTLNEETKGLCLYVNKDIVVSKCVVPISQHVKSKLIRHAAFLRQS